MMTRSEILDAMERGRLEIAGFTEANLQHASYYFGLDAVYRVPDQDGGDPRWHRLQAPNPYLTLAPGEYVHARSQERFRLAPVVFALVSQRSGMAWKNVDMVNAMFVDPGFPAPDRAAHLEFGLRLVGPVAGALRVGETIGKIVFFDVSDNPPGYPPEESSMHARFAEIVGRAALDGASGYSSSS